MKLTTELHFDGECHVSSVSLALEENFHLQDQHFSPKKYQQTISTNKVSMFNRTVNERFQMKSNRV